MINKDFKDFPRWLEMTRIDPGLEMKAPALIMFINDAVNEAIEWTADYPRDSWQPPFLTMVRRAGDCEDIAILKMAMLRAAGVPENRMWVGVCRLKSTGEIHAVLCVDFGVWAILDCRMSEVPPHHEEYQFAYFINRLGWIKATSIPELGSVLYATSTVSTSSH